MEYFVSFEEHGKALKAEQEEILAGLMQYIQCSTLRLFSTSETIDIFHACVDSVYQTLFSPSPTLKKNRVLGTRLSQVMPHVHMHATMYHSSKR